MRWRTAQRRESLGLALSRRVGGPDLWHSEDTEVARILASAPLEHIAVWLSTVAMTGARLGPLAIETICARVARSAPSFRASWVSDLVAVSDDARSLTAIQSSFEKTSDLCYELVRHQAADVKALGKLPAHEVANLAALGFYQSAAARENHSAWDAFSDDLETVSGPGVADVIIAGGLRHNLCWERSQLPWDFETAADVIAALIEKWGLHLVLLAAYTSTRSGVGPLAPVVGESLVLHCATLATRLGEDRDTVARLACELSRDLHVERALAAALALCA